MVYRKYEIGAAMAVIGVKELDVRKVQHAVAKLVQHLMWVGSEQVGH